MDRYISKIRMTDDCFLISALCTEANMELRQRESNGVFRYAVEHIKQILKSRIAKERRLAMKKARFQ